jgi:hypothetical protein
VNPRTSATFDSRIRDAFHRTRHVLMRSFSLAYVRRNGLRRGADIGQRAIRGKISRRRSPYRRGWPSAASVGDRFEPRPLGASVRAISCGVGGGGGDTAATRVELGGRSVALRLLDVNRLKPTFTCHSLDQSTATNGGCDGGATYYNGRE